MSTLSISDELAQAIQNEALARGLTVEDFLRAAILRERTLANRRKIEQEQAWWLSLPLCERVKYQGEYVAVRDQQLIDHDRDESVLHERIRAKYGRTAVLIMPAEGPKEIHIISPRLFHE